MIGEPNSSPDLFEPLVGFRFWKLKGEGLCSPWISHRWGPGIQEACCPGKSHLAPAQDCLCGFYAYHQAPTLKMIPVLRYFGNFRDSPVVWGAVRIWGHLEIHELGSRAQFMQPICLATHPLMRRSHRLAITSLAANHKLGVCTLKELKAYEDLSSYSSLMRAQA